MKRTLALFLSLLLLATGTTTALAETAILSVTTDTQAVSVMLMDETPQNISEILDMKYSDDQIDWTLRVTNSGASTATLYTMDANGNLLRTDISYDMSWFFGNTAGSGASTPAQETGDNPWSEESYAYHDVSIIPKPSDERVQSRCGPSRDYHGAGAYKTYKITSSQALFVEDGYVFIDLSYETVRRRRLYFSSNLLYSTDGVPSVTLSGHSARTTAKLIPQFGPGENYDDFEEAEIGSGTSISVFFEESGWVFAEFDCGLGTVRAWIRASQVSAD